MTKHDAANIAKILLPHKKLTHLCQGNFFPSIYIHAREANYR